jgi:O-antigen/teichoic acid export membrane protein
VNLLGYGTTSREAVYIVSGALLLDSLTYTVLGVFTAYERGELSAIAVVVERVLAAALGLGALAAGFGVVAVTAAYAISAAITLAVALWLMRRRVHPPRLDLSRARRREIRSGTWGFAAQEVLSIGVARADAVILSLMATTAVVGTYGAAYRLLEATLFIPLSLSTAFSAMFTYLGPRTEPTIQAVYQRALKLALALLTPCAVLLLVLAAPVIRLLYGDGFGGSAGPLRLLAPAVVLVGIVLLSSSLVVSRRDPGVMARLFGMALAINVGLNVALIPSLKASGAATAMLVTEVVFAAVAVGLAARAVGGISPARTLGAPLVGGGLMAAVLALLHTRPLLAALAGGVAYLAGFVLAERRLSPVDLRFVVDMVRRRFPSRAIG